MQTDIRVTILFYRNAILLRCLRKKRDSRSNYRFTLWETFRATRNVRNFLIVQSQSRRTSLRWYRQRARSGFAKYITYQVKTVDLHIYDKHHTIFTTQYTDSLAFLDILVSRFREGETQKLTVAGRDGYERNIEICRDKIYRVCVWKEK